MARPRATPRAEIASRGADPTDPRRRWYHAPEADSGDIAEVGRLLYQALAAIERDQLRHRYLHYVSALLVDGRAPPSFSFSMSANGSREASAMSNAMFRPPSLNCIGAIGDVLKERVWSRVSWLEFLPVSRSDFESRQRCTEANAWLSAFFEASEFEAMVSSCGADAATYGTSFVRTTPSLDGKTVRNVRVMVDEMRIPPDADLAAPKWLGQVAFENRDDLIAAYAKGKNAKAIEAEILRIPAAFRGFAALPGNYSDVVAVGEAFFFGTEDEAGRHVLALSSGMVLVDEEWTHGNPYSVLRYNKLPRSYQGKGMPENCLGLQAELDRMVACRAEAQRQASFPHVQIERSARIEPDAVMGAGVIEYTGTPVRFDVISGTPKDLDAGIAELERKIFLREGISQNTAGGDLPAGVDAAVAIESFQSIADTRLFSHAKNLERFIEDIGEKTIRIASVVKPKTRVGAKDISWPSVAADLKRSRMRAFPLSKLPSSLPGQQQQIERWAKSGVIDQRQRARLEGLPDPTGQLPLITASENAILATLDEIVATGQYSPPDSLADPQQAYELARAYTLRAKTDKLPQDRILQLRKFAAAAKAMLPPPAPTPAPGGLAPAPQQ